MRLARTLVAVAVLSGLALLVLSETTGLPRDRLLDGWILFVGALALAGLAHATRTAGRAGEESRYERALRRRPRPPERPKDLARLEREVAMSATTTFDLHIRLRPMLRTIAAHRLASRRGLDLDEGAAETRELLGPELWELLRPDREPPDDRLATGLPLARQRTALDRLERI